MNGSAIAVFLIFSNPFIFNEAMKVWEGHNEPLKSDTYSAVILLGGYSGWNTMHAVYSFNKASDRILKTFELYQTGKAKNVLLTGGSGLLLNPEERESALAQKYLIDIGMNPEHILLEKESKNTHENAEFSAALLVKTFGKEGNYLVVTSASHMRRAKRCFERTKLDYEYLRVDFQVDRDDYDLATFILPSASTLSMWQDLIKEWIGYVVYWINGYY